MTTYLITDGNGGYIRQDASGKYSLVRNRALADEFTDKVKAKNVLNNAVNKNLRKRYHIAEEYKQDPILSKLKPIAQQKVEDEFIKPNIEFSKRQCQLPIGTPQQWLDKLEPFKEFLSDVDSRRGDLLEQLSVVDQEVSDIQHYIEFGKFNAYQGYLAFSMLQKTLKRRRVIKDEYLILHQLGDCKVSMETMDMLKECAGQLNCRKYKPRVLKELFD